MAIRQYEELTAAVRGVQDAAKKALGSTVKDMKARAPGWIATAVTKRYAIKKGEVTPKSKNAKRPQAKAGDIKVTGETIETLTFTYEGHLLTPTHFGMKPNGIQTKRLKVTSKVPGAGIRVGGGSGGALVAQVRQPVPYQISYEVIKGQRKTLKGKYSTPPFLAPNRYGGVIPFQRVAKVNAETGKTTDKMRSIRTVSVPQMVGAESVEADFRESLNKGLMDRLQHHMDRQGLG